MHDSRLKMPHDRRRAPHPTKTYTSLADPWDAKIINESQDTVVN